MSDSLIEISGNFQIDKMYYIPKQYSVHVLAGSKIEFKTGGGLICNNDFKSIGTAEKPITFYCQDSTSNGITILNAPNVVEITHTKFNGLSNLNFNWSG